MSNVPVPSGALAPSTAVGEEPAVPMLRAVADVADRPAEGAALALVEPSPIRPKTFVTTRRQIDAYLRIKRSTGAISRHTESEFGYILSAFADHCPDDPAKITRRTVIRWMRTTEHLSANTRRQYHNRVRGFTSWLLRRGVIRKDPFEEITGPRVPRAMHRALSVGQAKALLAACETPRETVVVILGLHLGLRRCEMAGLEVGDVDLAARTIFVRHGKGGHERVLPLSVEACGVVGRYMVGASTGTALRSGPLLRSLKNPGAGLTPATIGEDFTKVAYRAGVKLRAWDRVGAHSLRHTAATNWYEDTADVLAVRDLLGHESLTTTQIYVRGMNVERLRAAVEGRTYLEPEGKGDPS